MKLFVPKELAIGERRVALSPPVAIKLQALGIDLLLETGAGLSAGFPDTAFPGLRLVAASEGASVADVVFKVQAPLPANIAHMQPGSVLVGLLNPYRNIEVVKALRDRRVTSFAMELVPRISRAQSMDALSSQAAAAGYKAALIAAEKLARFFPMLTTAAGTIRPAKVLVVGAGVAGLQAIATARRLGAIVTATDVRPATKEQVVSLGAKFIAVEDDEFKQAESAGGYAKEMSAAYQEKQKALTASHIAKQDVVITTALIPGRKAPVLITEAMVASMRPGSVIIDLAVERGGNCALSRPGEVVTSENGVKIVGHLNVAGRLAATASALYARNLFAFAETLIDKSAKAVAINWDDELVKATLLTKDGGLAHPNFQAAA
ncbi:MAG: Re/Si-specific NAD(P)(+) transhydrogenase subunit alpha [Bradyrhizobium sp.]